MNPIRARAAGYRSYSDIEFDFPIGCTAIVGPNGSGKSSLLELVPLALFGSPTRSLADYLNVDRNELLIELVFEHAGDLYRVRRMYSAKGRGKTTLDLERALFSTRNGYTDDAWTPMTRETAAATQALIEQTIGLSRETFLASAHLSQGDGDRFAAAAPAERKRVLAEILNLGLWDRLRDRARDDLKVAHDEELLAKGALYGLDELLATKGKTTARRDIAAGEVTQVTETLSSAETELEAATQEIARNGAAVERVRACEAETASASSELGRLREGLTAAREAAVHVEERRLDLAGVEVEAARIPKLEADVDRIRAAIQAAGEAHRHRDALIGQIDQRQTALSIANGRIDSLTQSAFEMLQKADHLDNHIDLSALCDRCGQTLGAEAAARAAASYRADAAKQVTERDELTATCIREQAVVAELTAELGTLAVPETLEDPSYTETLLRAARTAAERRGALAEQIRQFAELATQIPDLAAREAAAAEILQTVQAELDLAKNLAGDPDILEAKAGRWRVAVQEARSILEGRQADLVRATEQVERVVVAEDQAAAERIKIARLQDRTDLLKLAERAYGRDGIPALILESSAIPTIEVETNRILAELGTQFHLELRTQKALKTSEVLRETLDVIVYDGNDARPYETFSGGEKTRIGLALRLALAGLLAHRRGAQSSVLCIDELDGLDSAGMDALVGVLNGLSETFERILIVSHQAQLATSFDQVIEVEKRDGLSRIVGTREAVLA